MYTNEFEAYKAVKRDPMQLGNVETQTLAVCRKATRDLPLSIVHVRDKNLKRELILEAMEDFKTRSTENQKELA